MSNNSLDNDLKGNIICRPTRWSAGFPDNQIECPALHIVTFVDFGFIDDYATILRLKSRSCGWDTDAYSLPSSCMS
jgi:hypothetical protein